MPDFGRVTQRNGSDTLTPFAVPAPVAVKPPGCMHEAAWCCAPASARASQGGQPIQRTGAWVPGRMWRSDRRKGAEAHTVRPKAKKGSAHVMRSKSTRPIGVSRLATAPVALAFALVAGMLAAVVAPSGAHAASSPLSGGPGGPGSVVSSVGHAGPPPGTVVHAATYEQAPPQAVKDRATLSPTELARYGLPPRPSPPSRPFSTARRAGSSPTASRPTRRHCTIST